MTATIDLLKLLAGGQELAPDELEKALGMSQQRVSSIIHLMRKGRYMRLAPVRYEITPRGQERVARIIARDQRVAAVEEARAKRVAERAAGKRAPLGRPRMSEAERAERLQGYKDARKKKYAAAKLERSNRKAAERAAAETKRQAVQDAELRFVHNVVKAGVEPDDLIAQTLKQQPALQAAWGALAEAA